MKKINFLKKNKWTFLSLCVGLTTVGCVTPILVSCNKNTYDVGNYDKVYHVDDVMYRRLEKEIRTSYNSTLSGKTKHEIDKAMKKLDEKLAFFRKQKQNKNLSYTVATNSLLKFVSSTYGLNNITRDFSEHPINWVKESSNFSDQLKSTLKSRFCQKGVSSKDIQTNLRVFDKKFGDLCTTVYQKYSDPLLRIMELKNDSLSCLEDMDNHLSYLAAQNQLKKFVGNFDFKINKSGKNSSPIYYDELKKRMKVNSDLSNFIETNFSIIRHDKGGKKEENGFDLNKLISGYHIIPILKGWEEDPEKNTFAMLIDWEIISNQNYQTSLTKHEIAFRTAAHSAILKNQQNHPELLKDTENFAFILNHDIPDSEKNFTRIPLPCSAEKEKDNLYNTYLKNIEFGWDKTNETPDKPYPNCAYETFYTFCATDDPSSVPTSGTLNQESLSLIGLTLRDVSEKEKDKSKPIRLDKILKDIKLYNEKKAASGVLPDNILYKFMQNCAIESNTKIKVESGILDANHDVSNTLYAGYKTSHSELQDEEPAYSESNRARKVWIKQNLDCVGMPFSKKFYDNTYDKFKPVKQWSNKLSDVEMYTGMQEKAELVMEILSIIEGFLGAEIGIRLVYMIISKDARHWALFITSVVYIGASIGVDLAIKRWKSNVDDKIENNQKMRNSDQWKTVSKIITDDENGIFASYETFNKAPFLKIIGKSQYYSNFEASHAYADLKEQENFKKMGPNEARTLTIQLVFLMIGVFATYILAYTAYRIASKIAPSAAAALEGPSDFSIQGVFATKIAADDTHAALTFMRIMSR